jgi:hypothetical protein
VPVCLGLSNPLDDRIPILSPVDSESRLGQLKLVILPPLASILDLILFFVAELFGLTLDLRQAFVPIVVPKQQDGDRMWGRPSLERVLCRVVDQDLCVDLLANLNATGLSPLMLSYFLRVLTSALVSLVVSSCPFANVLS